jgi:hypothetical protein
MNAEECISVLSESDRIQELSEMEVPSRFPDSHLEILDCLFYREDPSIFLSIRTYSRIAEIRLFHDTTEDITNGVQLYTISRDTGNSIESIISFVTSKYLHNPTLNFRCSLMGYNPETDMCYALEAGSIKEYEPTEMNPLSFTSCHLAGVWNDGFEFTQPDLKAVLAPPEDSASRKYRYVFTEAMIEVDIRRDTNFITPFVYDDAWRDYLDESDGDVIQAYGEYSTELVTEEI